MLVHPCSVYINAKMNLRGHQNMCMDNNLSVNFCNEEDNIAIE